jgi:hypothetical protein
VRVDTLSPSVAVGCVRHPHVHAHITNETVLEVIDTRPAAQHRFLGQVAVEARTYPSVA